MKIQTDSLNKQKERCINFSKEYDVPLQDIYAKAEEEYEKIYPKVYSNILKEKNIDENQSIPEEISEIIDKNAKEETERRSLIRARSSFKRKAVKNQQIKKNGIPAFILMRFRDNDFENNAIRRIDEFIEENGEEEAIRHQYIDNEGNYLHSQFTSSSPNQYGKKIDKGKVKGAAVGFFETEKDDGTKEYDARYIRSDYMHTTEVPICQSCVASVKEGNNASALFSNKNTYWINGAIADNDNPIVSLDFANYIIGLCNKFLDSNRFVDTYNDFISICESQIDNREKISYAGVNATCSSINPLDIENPESDVVCEFEIYDDDNGEIHSIGIYTPFERFRNMALIEGASGILFVSGMYYNKDGEIKYHLGGFLPISGE